MPEKRLISEKQLENAKIFQDRWSWAKQLPDNINFMELGVAAGDFSHFLLTNIKLNNLYLIDLYNHNDFRTGWDEIKSTRFNSTTHYNFVKERFKSFNNVKMIKGFSHNVMQKLINDNKIKFDVVYLDTDHKKDQLLKEIPLAIKLLKPNGILAFNDFIVHTENDTKYDTISVVVDFLYDNLDWEVIGFALDTYMYCDIYLRKISSTNGN